MAEPDFERRLERLFADPPQDLDDAEVFTRKIEGRLQRGWAVRRWTLGVAGVAGGLIAGGQLVVSGVHARTGAVASSLHELILGLHRTARSDWLSILPAESGVVWTALGLAVLLTGLVVMRVIEEI